MDFSGRLIAGIIAIMVILVFPLQYIAGLNSEDIGTLVDDNTHSFTDAIRDMGYLDKQTYEAFIGYLDTTGEMYDLELQDIHPVTGEEMVNMAVGGLMSEPVLYDCVSDREIQSFATHTHNSDCYAGDLHVCDGISCEYEGDAIVVAKNNHQLQYSYNGITWTSIPSLYITDLTYGSNMFLAVSGTKTYTSENGINWTYHDAVFKNASGYVVNYQNMKFMAVTYFDAVNYTNRSSSFYAIVSYNDQGNGYTTGLAASQDGINWDLGYSYHKGTNITMLDIGMVGSSIYVSYDHNQNPTYDSGYLSFENYKYKGSGSDEFYPPKLIRYDSYTVKYNKGNYKEFDEFHSANGIEIKIRSVNNSLNYTLNGEYIKNTDHNFPIGNTLYGNMICFGDKFMLQTAGKIYISYDGLNWTSYSSPLSNYTKFVCNASNGTGEIDRGPCSKIGKYYDSNGVEVHPICDQVVTSISATKPTQTVKKGESIITTATATYLDGHTGTVNCTSDFNTNLIGTQTVTLTYTGLVGNAKTNGTRTCTLSVIVKPNKSLTSISVTPASQTIKKYAYPSITVKAHYNDGTSKVLTSTQYEMIGFNPASLGLQKVTVSYTENEITKSVVINATVKVLDKKCPRCQIVYDMNPDDSDPGCPNCKQLVTGIEVTPNNIELTQGDSLPVTVIALYNDGSKNEVSGWTSNYKAERLGIQIVTVEYGGYAADIIVWVNEGLVSCPICGNEYLPSENECPVCANQVISISASPKVITVVQYQQIPLTVTAYFANGSSRIVDDWSIDQATLTPGTYTASVSYKGISDTITLTVLSINNVVCPICGTNYDSSENLRGCPVCSVELVGIEAYLTSGSNLVQLGTSPALAVILIFRDGHREFAADGYTLEDFNPDELGIQTVRVVYRGFYTTVVIEVVNILDTLTCPNGHVYYKNQDGTDPGCPFCHEDENVSKILYYDITYTSEILDKVYSIGIYNFSQGNYISVILTKRDKSLMYRVQNTFFSTSMLGRKRKFIYGGEVY